MYCIENHHMLKPDFLIIDSFRRRETRIKSKCCKTMQSNDNYIRAVTAIVKYVGISAVLLTTLPPQISVDLGLSVVDVNATWARLMWRKFTEFELHFIDGVQLRYKEKDGKVMILHIMSLPGMSVAVLFPLKY
jgi:predicted metal-dependent RNase